MAKPRQAQFTAEEVMDRPDLADESADLWGEHTTVARSLLTSAVQCFATNGFHATTTRDIATVAKLSPAGMYVHFPSKEHVLFEIVRAAHQRALAAITSPEIVALTDPADRLRRLMEVYTEFHARYHVASRVSQFDLAALSRDHYAEILELRHRTNQVFHAALASGVEAGDFEIDDVKRVSRAMLSLSIDLVRWYRSDGQDSPSHLGELNGSLALKMVHPTAVPTVRGPAASARRR